MARRNIFQPPPPPNPGSEAGQPDSKPRFPNTGAMSGVKSTLRDLSSNAVREIDPSLIGGIRLQIGNRIFDSSVSAKLDRLKKQLIG